MDDRRLGGLLPLSEGEVPVEQLHPDDLDEVIDDPERRIERGKGQALQNTLQQL
jgi:hypothetical protein